MKNKFSICFILFTVFSLSSLFSNAQVLEPVKWTYDLVQLPNGNAEIVANCSVEENWHLYALVVVENPAPDFFGPIPTSMDFVPNDSYELVGSTKETKEPILHFDPVYEADLRFFEESAGFKNEIKVLQNKPSEINLVLNYMACDDSKCIFPDPIPINIRTNNGKAVDYYIGEPNSKELLKATESNVKDVPDDNKMDSKSDSANNNDEVNENKKDPEDIENGTAGVSSEGDPSSQDEVTENGSAENKDTMESQGDKKKESRSLLTLFFLSFAGGLAVLFTPCVFPMIPMTVSFFTKQSKDRAKGIRNALIYGVSIILIYVILGTIVTAIFGSDALNALSTNVWFNLFFFVMLVVFAISFMGAFEITLPNSWINKADSASDKGGMIGIFFMAFTLALVSFSCTGPVVGPLLVEAAGQGGIGPIIGMFGFALALALPFTLFAIFPGWLNSLPKSGGWLNTVKVFLGFLELAFAFKFLSNADLVVQGHWLERELFLAIWIGIFSVLALYLFGFIRLPHDDKVEKISVGRALLGISTFVFVIYLIPGMWGAPLKMIAGFPPPSQYSESPSGFGGGGMMTSGSHDHPDDTHLGPHGLYYFNDYDLAKKHAEKVNKPLFVDFTGWACVNCRRMEENVWSSPEVLKILRDDLVIVSLYVDDKNALPESEFEEIEFGGKTHKVRTIGKKWSMKQMVEYSTNTQPYYVLQDANGNDLSNGSADYDNHSDPVDFLAWMKEGLEEVK